jgi:Regulator of chromosome condensation (RCC1) repeat/Putative Ig domain
MLTLRSLLRLGLVLFVIAFLMALVPSVPLVATSSMSYHSLSVASDHLCALRLDDTVMCWGHNNVGQGTPPAGTFTQISGATGYTCGVQSDATLRCWGGPFGSDDYGQARPPTGIFTQISSGDIVSCGIPTGGTAVCWGWSVPGVMSPPPGSFVQLSVGQVHVCGLKTDHTITCWGLNTDGQIDAPSGEFTFVDAGGFYTCGLRSDGQVVCWGRDDDGERSLPPGQYLTISAGDHRTCGIDTLHTVVCRGWDGPFMYPPPATNPLFGNFTEVGSADAYECAIRSDGTLSCSGASVYYRVPAIAVSMTSQTQTSAIKMGSTIATSAPFRFTASGGTGCYSFNLVSGSLPTGLTLNTDGTVSGTEVDTTPHYVEIEAIDTVQVSGVEGFWFHPPQFLPLITAANQ